MEVFQISTPSKDMLEELDFLAAHVYVLTDRGPEQCLQSEGEGIFFVDTMMSDVEVTTLLDTIANNNFVSQKNINLFHSNYERNTTMFKQVKSTT